MAKWELVRIPIPLEVSKEDDLRKRGKFGEYFFPKWGDCSDEVWQEANELDAEGWELVTAVPYITGHEETIHSSGTCYSDGFLLLFKRPVIENSNPNELRQSTNGELLMRAGGPPPSR